MFVVRVKYKGNTNLVGPFNHRVMAENWISTAQDWIISQFGDKYDSATFKVVPLMAPYKTRTVSVLNTTEEGE